MSQEIASRLGWLVDWLGQWRGRSNSSGMAVPGAQAWQDQQNRVDQHDNQKDNEWDHWFDDLSSDAEIEDSSLFTASLAAKHVKAAVEQLPPRQREILLLHVNNELTYWEIAERLGLTEQAVLSDLSHAYSQLRVDLPIEELRR
jgi:RNA polymerase sigma factor (sigma-70 family)